MKKSALNILLIEDNPADIRLIVEAFKEIGANHHINTVHDGAEAITYLNGAERNAVMPQLIILDLNLPKIHGREVLETIKTEAKFRYIPVIVLSNSSSEQDIRKCYELHANCYISKPVDFSSFVEVVMDLEKFWFSTARLPT